MIAHNLNCFHAELKRHKVTLCKVFRVFLEFSGQTFGYWYLVFAHHYVVIRYYYFITINDVWAKCISFQQCGRTSTRKDDRIERKRSSRASSEPKWRSVHQARRFLIYLSHSHDNILNCRRFLSCNKFFPMLIVNQAITWWTSTNQEHFLHKNYLFVKYDGLNTQP